MNHEEAGQAHSLGLDGRLAESRASELKEHLAGCPECVRETAMIERFHRALNLKSAIPPVPAGLEAVVKARLLSEGRPTFRRRAAVWAMAIAAALLGSFLIRRLWAPNMQALKAPITPRTQAEPRGRAKPASEIPPSPLAHHELKVGPAEPELPRAPHLPRLNPKLQAELLRLEEGLRRAAAFPRSGLRFRGAPPKKTAAEEDLEQTIAALGVEPKAGKILWRIYQGRIERADLVVGLKRAGKVGESSEGMLKAPPGAPSLKEDEASWVAEENAGRREILRLFAEGDPEAFRVRISGQDFASVRARLTEPGEWVQTPGGSWKKAPKGAP